MNISEVEIQKLKQSLEDVLKQATTEQAVEEIRVAFVGRNGSITLLLGKLKELTLEEKKVFGPQLNNLRAEAEQAIRAKKEAVIAAQIASVRAREAHFDVTAYEPSYRPGSLHPLTQFIERMEDVFFSMGFEEAEGLEVDTPEYAFDLLNIPANHPARDMQDTLWLELPGRLLRSQMSDVQAHTMKTRKPPLAIFAPGRTYRHDATDATHDFTFMQCEGLVIDKGISIAHLLATIEAFMQALFDKKTLKIRVRPSYFPFVEPGLEVDISCLFCTQGCSICKKSGWIELGGAGLVHPNVLKACGISPEVYSGFAWGFGIERMCMIQNGINDVRLFKQNKISFLEQF